MLKKIAVITDIHGNLEALETILEDIKKNHVDDIISLGDTIGIGPNSKECLDLLINNNVKMTLGDYELYVLRGTNIDKSITEIKKEHCNWIKNSLTDKELKYLENCPLEYEYTIKYNAKIEDYKIKFSHYLINDMKAPYPFEITRLDKDINLWLKHNKEREEHIIGHLHNSFNVNKVDGIQGDYITATGNFANIITLDSAGCTKNNKTSYLLITIDKGINHQIVTLEYDRKNINIISGDDFY